MYQIVKGSFLSRGLSAIGRTGSMTRPTLEVIIPAEFPRKPRMTRNDLLNKNASIVRDLATWIAENSSKTLDGIISKPVN